VDYFSPQLYWQIEPKETSFPVLLEWWSQQNAKQRHLWPGLSVANALSRNWSVNEIANQIQITRKQAHVNGYIFYNTSSLLTNNSLLEILKRDVQSEQVLVPASPWLSDAVPERPTATVTGNTESLTLNWTPVGTNAVRWWLVQSRAFGHWQTEILPAGTRSKSLNLAPEAISVSAIDRFGNASAPSVLQPQKLPAHRPRILQRKY
jgi:hypothetical protein